MAMRDINLIPGEILERRTLVRHLFLWSGSLVVLAFILLVLYGSLVSWGDWKGPTANKDLKPELLKAVEDIKKEQTALNLALRERAQLGALMGKRLAFSPVLAKLSEIMNDQTWLTQLAADKGPDGKFHLIMTGLSSSHATLGIFIQRLSGAPMFRQVVLKSAQASELKSSGTAPVMFQIECDIAEGLP